MKKTELSTRIEEEHLLLMAGRLEEAVALDVAGLIKRTDVASPSDAALARRNGQLYRAASQGLADAIAQINHGTVTSEGRYLYGPSGKRIEIARNP